MATAEQTPKRRRTEAEEDDSWNIQRSRGAKRRDKRNTPEGMRNAALSTLTTMTALTTMRAGPATTTPRFNKFLVVASTPNLAYKDILLLHNQTQGIGKYAADCNSRGQWILTPHNQTTYNFFKSYKRITLQELHQEERRSKAVLLKYPLAMDTDDLVGMQNIIQAERMSTRTGKATTSVLVTFEGPAPSCVEYLPFGIFLLRTYNPEPLRCYKCQRFGHHKSQCHSPERCAVCSGRHPTALCLAKHSRGEATSPQCPNCNQQHHAWNRRCKERLRRIQETHRRNQGQDLPTSRPAPAPAPRLAPRPAPRTSLPAARPQQSQQQQQVTLRPRPVVLGDYMRGAATSSAAAPSVRPKKRQAPAPPTATAAAAPATPAELAPATPQRPPRHTPRKRLHVPPTPSPRPAAPAPAQKKTPADAKDKTVGSEQQSSKSVKVASEKMATALSAPAVPCTSDRTVALVDLNRLRHLLNGLMVEINAQAGFPLATQQMSPSVNRFLRLLMAADTADPTSEEAASGTHPVEGPAQRKRTESQ